MIKTENEYRLTKERVQAQAERMRRERDACKAEGCTPEETERLLDPIETFHAQLCEEVESYERLKKGDFEELNNLQDLGRLLVAIRIHRGLSQRELAEKLDVHESQVSRDERNDYHGITVERARRILEVMNVELRSQIHVLPLKQSQSSRANAPSR